MNFVNVCFKDSFWQKSPHNSAFTGALVGRYHFGLCQLKMFYDIKVHVGHTIRSNQAVQRNESLKSPSQVSQVARGLVRLRVARTALEWQHGQTKCALLGRLDSYICLLGNASRHHLGFAVLTRSYLGSYYLHRYLVLLDSQCQVSYSYIYAGECTNCIYIYGPDTCLQVNAAMRLLRY